MTLRKLLPLAFLFVAGVALSQGKADDPAADLKKFEGTWVLVSGKKDGQPVAADHVKKSRITWKGSDVVVETPHQSQAPMKAKSMLAAGGPGPKRMDFTRANGPDAGTTLLAIYEFRGPDEYVVVFASAGRDRPKEFDAKAGSGHTMHVWKRAKS